MSSHKSFTQQYFIDTINECMKSCGDLWEESNKNKINDVSNDMKELFSKYIDLKQDFDIYLDIKKEFDGPLNEINQQISNYKRIHFFELNENKKALITEQLSKIQIEEEVIVEKKSKSGYLCPISQKIPDNPIISKKCGHIFEKSAIFSYIQTKKDLNQVVSCPVAGCKFSISKNDLYEDPQINKEILDAKKSLKEDEYQKIE